MKVPQIQYQPKTAPAEKQCSPESFKPFASLIKNSERNNKASPANKEAVSAFEEY